MSQENLQVVRDLMQAFNARDGGAISHYADDVEYRLIGGFSGLSGQMLKGREAVLEFAWELIETLEARFEVERLAEVDDRVVLIASTAGAGGESGAPVTQRWGQIDTFREGKITAVDNYWEANQALEAVGLAE